MVSRCDSCAMTANLLYEKLMGAMPVNRTSMMLAVDKGKSQLRAPFVIHHG
jgi:hypothetical protein